jgi:hypothetical protein
MRLLTMVVQVTELLHRRAMMLLKVIGLNEARRKGTDNLAEDTCADSGLSDLPRHHRYVSTGAHSHRVCAPRLHLMGSFIVAPSFRRPLFRSS